MTRNAKSTNCQKRLWKSEKTITVAHYTAGYVRYPSIRVERIDHRSGCSSVFILNKQSKKTLFKMTTNSKIEKKQKIKMQLKNATDIPMERRS